MGEAKHFRERCLLGALRQLYSNSETCIKCKKTLEKSQSKRKRQRSFIVNDGSRDNLSIKISTVSTNQKFYQKSLKLRVVPLLFQKMFQIQLKVNDQTILEMILVL